jgi:outer membrane protein OmpA-like peptidoglycan-associated protein
LSTLLAGQGPNLQGAIDGRLTSALGFASPTAFLSGLGGDAADAARRAGAAVAGGAVTAATAAAATAVTAKSGLMRWLPWLIGLAVLWFLWNMFSGKPATPPASPAVSTAPAAAPASAPAAAAMAVTPPEKVYFEVGSSTVGGDGSKTIAAVADMTKKDGAKLTLTGYTDKTGDATKNEELAKARAVAVRTALTAAGIAEANIEMRVPIFVEVGTGGGDAEARRVDIGEP